MQIGTTGTRELVTCVASDTVLQAAELMRNGHVGDVIVVQYRDGKPVPIGIVTDRDLVLQVLAVKDDPASVTVDDVMSRKLVIAYEGEQLEVIMERMRGSCVRRMPLVDSAGMLVGIATLDDVIERLTATLVEVSRISQLQSREEKQKRM